MRSRKTGRAVAVAAAVGGAVAAGGDAAVAGGGAWEVAGTRERSLQSSPARIDSCKTGT